MRSAVRIAIRALVSVGAGAALAIPLAPAAPAAQENARAREARGALVVLNKGAATASLIDLATGAT
jgi:hypothetical protein